MSRHRKQRRKQSLKSRAESRKYERGGKSLFRNRGFIGFMLIVVAAAAVLAVVSVGQTPNPNNVLTCNPNGTPLALDAGTWVFIRLGNGTDANTRFLRIPNYMGIEQTCFWTVNTRGNGTSERGPYYTLVHVQSPTRGHSTLRDMFYVWGESYLRGGDRMYFESDGIGQYRGSVRVFEYANMDDANAMNTSAAYRVTTYGNTVLGPQAILIWLPDPYTSGNPAWG